jgi:hypothetical protein
MTSSKKIYNISTITQLIDLNGDIANFSADFSVKSLNNGEFDMLVIDQTSLDSGKTPEYKKIKGHVSGSVSSDKNTYQNYFIILKADKPCECEVSIDVSEIEPFSRSKDIERFENRPKQKYKVSQEDPASSCCFSKNWRAILAVFFVIGVLVYFFSNYSGSKTKAKTPKNSLTQSSSEESNFESILDKLMPTEN